MQKKIIAVGIIIGALMGLYPPWTINTTNNYNIFQRTEITRTESKTYSWIFDPPKIYSGDTVNTAIDLTRLILQWIILGAITIGALIFIKNTNSNNTNEKKPNTPTSYDI